MVKVSSMPSRLNLLFVSSDFAGSMVRVYQSVNRRYLYLEFPDCVYRTCRKDLQSILDRFNDYAEVSE